MAKGKIYNGLTEIKPKGKTNKGSRTITGNLGKVIKPKGKTNKGKKFYSAITETPIKTNNGIAKTNRLAVKSSLGKVAKPKRYNLAKRTRTAVNNIAKRYRNYANQYAKQVNRQRNADIAASNAQYTANSQSAALRNAVQQRELQRQMYRNGITGGASETTMFNAANNYANQQTKISNDKAAAANTIRQKANADKAAFRLQNAQARDTAMDSARDREYNKYQNYLKRKDTLNERRYQRGRDRVNDARYRSETRYKRRRDRVNDARYRNETKYNRRQVRGERYARGYSNVKSVNNAIKKIKKSGKGKWRLPYLRAWRTELKNRDYERAQANKKK